MNPAVAFAVRADYNGRWANQVINDAKAVAANVNDTGAAVGKSMGNASVATSNLAAQFNDIGVTLASGQSPFLIALQQGTQISQVLGPMGVGGAAKALGSAFMSLLSPINLITIATIGLGGAAIQWLMSINQQAPTAEERLKAHREWLSAIIEGYEGAEDAFEKYLAGVQKLPQAVAMEELRAGQKQSLDELNKAFDDLLGKQVRLSRGDNPAAGKMALEMKAWQRALSDGSLSLDEIQLKLLQLKRQDDLPQPIREFAKAALEAVGNLRDATAYSRALAAAVASISFPALPEGYADALKQLDKLGQPTLNDREQAGAARDQGLAGSQDTITRTAILNKYNDALARIGTREAEEEALKRSKEFEATSKQQAEAYRNVTSALEFELELVGLNAVEQEKLNEIRAAGVEASSAEADAIRDKVQALADARDAQDLIDSMKSPVEAAEEQFARLDELRQADLISWEQYAFGVGLVNAKVTASTGAMVGKVGDILGSLGSIMESAGEEQFGVAKGFAVASAVLKGYEAVTSAYAAGMATGNPALAVLYAAAAAAATGAQIANILSTTSSSTSMAGGGVGGGAGAGGDANTAAAPQAASQGVILNLHGDTFGRDQIKDLVGQMNEQLGLQGKEIVVRYIGSN